MICSPRSRCTETCLKFMGTRPEHSRTPNSQRNCCRFKWRKTKKNKKTIPSLSGQYAAPWNEGGFLAGQEGHKKPVLLFVGGQSEHTNCHPRRLRSLTRFPRPFACIILLDDAGNSTRSRESHCAPCVTGSIRLCTHFR